MGDVNMPTDAMGFCKDLMDDEGWLDVGGNARTWGAKENEHACMTAAAKKPSRIGIMLASPIAIPLTRDFRVCHDDGLPAHSTLQVKINTEQIIYEIESNL